MAENGNQLQVDAWRVMEALLARHWDLATVEDLAGDTGLHPAKVRRILVTWEELGLAEQRGGLWRASHYLTHELPGRMMSDLADHFYELAEATELKYKAPAQGSIIDEIADDILGRMQPRKEDTNEPEAG